MTKKIVVWLFCLILGGSFLVFNIFSRQLSGDNHENRLLTTLPEVFQGSLSGLPGRLDQFMAPNRHDKIPQFNWGWIKNTLVKRKNLLC